MKDNKITAEQALARYSIDEKGVFRDDNGGYMLACNVIPYFEELRKDAERYRAIRDLNCLSVSLTKNEHKEFYRTTEQCLDEDYQFDVPEEEKAKMISHDQIWTAHVYERTPVGFVRASFAQLDDLIDSIISNRVGHGDQK